MSIETRRGCDQAPVDISTHEGALRLRSYIWPDEPARLARLGAGIEIARAHPAVVETDGAASWIERHLAETHQGRLTVVWQSVMRQYLDQTEQRELQARMEHAGRAADRGHPLAWLTIEPGGADHLSNFTLSCRSWPGDVTVTLADTSTHGPPVSWWPPH